MNPRALALVFVAIGLLVACSPMIPTPWPTRTPETASFVLSPGTPTPTLAPARTLNPDLHPRGAVWHDGLGVWQYPFEIVSAVIVGGSVSQGVTAWGKYLYAAVGDEQQSFAFRRYNLGDFSDAGEALFQVGDVPLWNDPVEYRAHVSTFAVNPLNGLLYVPVMDLIAYEDPGAKNRTGIIEATPGFEIVGFYDTSAIFNYLDAIDFDESGRLWASPGMSEIASVGWGPDGPDFSDTQEMRMEDSWRFLQGIRVYDRKLYAVPAGTTVSPANGIAVFSVAELLENGNTATAPLYQYNYNLPEGSPDPEGFDLDPNDHNIAYVTSFNRQTIWTLRLEPPLESR